MKLYKLDNLKHWIQMSNLSQKQIIIKLEKYGIDISQSQLSKTINGKVMIYIDFMIAIAAILGIPPEELFYGEPDEGDEEDLDD